MSTDMGRPVRSDVGEQSTAMDALRDSALRWPLAQHCNDPLEASTLRALIETSPHAMLVADSDGRLCIANAAAARMLRVPQTELHRGLLHDCVMALNDLEGPQLGRLSAGAQQPQRFEVRLGDGRLATASQRTLVDRWDRPTHVCLELEERAEPRGASVLDLVGRIAGELAHDINNQLSAALNYVFVLQRRLGRVPEVTPHLEGLHNATWQAAMLADGLKVMGRRRDAEPEDLQLDEVVTQVMPLLRHLVHGGRVELRCDQGLPVVRAPLAYAEQLIISLALSAIRRGSGERSLLVRVASVPGPDANPRVRLSCELASAPAGPCDARALRSLTAPRGTHHGALRRAVKLCGARLHHDARRIWVEFKR